MSNNKQNTHTEAREPQPPQGVGIAHTVAHGPGAIIQDMQGDDGMFNNGPGHCERITLSVNCNKNSPVTMACRTDVIVHGVILDAIIDTGAVRTMISNKIYEKFKNLLGVMEVTEISLHSASGNECKILREVQLNFVLRGLQYTQKAIVADMGHIELLLGMDFLYRSGATIDLKNKELLLPDQVVPLRSHKLTHAFPVRLNNTSNVMRNREGALCCECKGWPEHTPALFESMSDMGRDIALVDAIVTPRNGKFTIPVRNHSSLNESFMSGLYIGSLAQIDTEHGEGGECLAIYAPAIFDQVENPTLSPRRPHAMGCVCATIENSMLSKQNCEGSFTAPLTATQQPNENVAAVSFAKGRKSCDNGRIHVSKTNLAIKTQPGARTTECPEHLQCVLPEGGLTSQQRREATALCGP
jgi:predicted aspartyl protease